MVDPVGGIDGATSPDRPEDRQAGGPTISLYEVPIPSSRTRREMETLLRAGFSVAAVHRPDRTEEVRSWGYDSIRYAPGGGHRLRNSLLAKLRTVDVEQPLDVRHEQVWQAMLDIPTPQLMARSADLNVLAYEWVGVAEALAARPADIFWAADLDALPAVVWAARSSPGSRIVFDAHELFTELDYIDPLQRGDWEHIARTFIPFADLVLTVCEPIAEVLTDRYGARRTLVIHNLAVQGSACDRSVRQELSLPADTPLLVHVGNVVSNRRPELVVDALVEAPDVHVAFVGEVRDGQDELLMNAARGRGVESRLHFVPPVPVEHLVDFLRDADGTLILYSGQTSLNLKFAMPNKLFDSLAAGLPVVATAGTAAARFLTEEGLGEEFEDGDAASLAAAIRRLLAAPERARRVASRRQEFVWTTDEASLVKAVRALAEDAQPADVLKFNPYAKRGRRRPPAPSWRENPLARGRAAAAWRIRRLRRWASQRR